MKCLMKVLAIPPCPPHPQKHKEMETIKIVQVNIANKVANKPQNKPFDREIGNS